MIIHNNDFKTINSFTRSVMFHKRVSILMLSNHNGGLYIIDGNKVANSNDMVLLTTDQLKSIINSKEYINFKNNFRFSLKDYQILARFFVNRVLPNLLFTKGIFLRESS